MLSALRQTLAGVACRRVTTSVAATAATTTTKRGVLTSNSSVVEVDNPYTGQVRTFPLNSIAEVNAAIARAADAVCPQLLLCAVVSILTNVRAGVCGCGCAATRMAPRSAGAAHRGVHALHGGLQQQQALDRLRYLVANGQALVAVDR